jgi:uncharacterized protein YecE (DUF72 family)
MGEILIGTSGFSFDDWVGEVYPAGIKKQDMLPYYEQRLGFRALEVNFTYYALPSVKTMESFCRRTSQDFAFVVKAFKGMTHERGPDLDTQFRLFKEGVKPLGENLKALLFQFPFGFLPDSRNKAYLGHIREEFADYRTVVEFRNSRWLEDGHLDVLRDLSMGYCIVDEPKLKGLVPFAPALTSDLGYFRFHGRNRRWFREPLDVRYDYLYSEKELESFIPAIEKVAEKASSTFVFFNNCHAGKAARNGMELMEMLKSKPAGGAGQGTANGARESKNADRN